MYCLMGLPGVLRVQKLKLLQRKSEVVANRLCDPVVVWVLVETLPARWGTQLNGNPSYQQLSWG